MIYREFKIEAYWLPQFAKYSYAHKDYDGEGDSRCGYANSIEKCKQSIDEHWGNQNES